VAGLIAEGCVVGWFQGRMEWGPRALGNRSILCDPRRPDMKEILNERIKRRESFRPFAPSILREQVGAWFETDYDVPFMLQVYRIREARRAEIPAVAHVDGTGRLQTVTQSQNPRYYRLIDAFRQRTGVPLVLNTSFNENEPIVRRPGEAIACFLRTRMDALVLGNWLTCRRDRAQGAARETGCVGQVAGL
jgi:carbamoyltransferase